ncbi:hypothetical protein BYT27DRAFT_7111550, partial [Phlegmacium glaucopus]
PLTRNLPTFVATSRNFQPKMGHISSITESRDITAVKNPWRRSSRHEALGQMLVTNQQLDKLAATKDNFISRGILLRFSEDPWCKTLQLK